MFSRLFFITMLFGLSAGSMEIYTNQTYFVMYQAVEINCTSSVIVNYNNIAINVGNITVANIFYETSTGNCMRFVDLKHVDCPIVCKCTTDGKSISYVYNVTTDRTVLQLQCFSPDPFATNSTEIKIAMGSKYAHTSCMNGGPTNVSINVSSPVKVTERESLGPISCLAINCTPDCTYIWTGPGGFISNESKLQINDIRRTDTGKYICKGANAYGEDLDHVIIFVQYGPSALTLNPASELYTINETGKFGPISCSADCNPPCNMTWTGLHISTLNFTTTNLSIPKIDRLNTGQFTCTAKNIISSINTTVHVTVNYRPANVSINASSQVYVKEGQHLGPIPCTADCVPSCIYIWSGPNNFTRNDSKLQINHINRTDDGTYSCMGYNSIGFSSNDVEIKVQYGPADVYLNPFDATYISKEGDTLGPISCMANCYPACTVTWTGRQKISSDTTVNNMSIPDINRNDSGQYICTANNSIGMNWRIVNVTVNYAAEISSVEISNTNGSNVKENTSLQFMCEAIGLPKPTVKWLYSNTEGITKHISDIYKFIIPSSSCTDTGTYTCVVQNEGFSANNSSLSLNVLCPPRFMNTCSTNNNNIIPVKRNQSIHIHACFLSNPAPLLNWIKTYGNNSSDIAESEICLFKNTSLVYTTVVEIELGEEIEVNITVLAENDIGESSKTGFRIRIEDKPFTPIDVHVSCKEINRIQWVSNFNGGSDQVFSIRYTENNETYFLSPFNVTDGGESTRHEYILDNLRPKTFYHFNVIAINRINSTESNLVSCRTSGNTNYVVAALGTSSGLLFIIGFAVGILLYKIRINNRSTGKEKSLIQRQAANLDDDETDGLKDNPLYGSHNETGKQAKGMQDNHLNNDTSDIYENQMPMKNITQSSHTTKPKMNQDGLTYADLDFIPSGSTFVIRGIENRNAYAIIDLNKSAEPLPSSDDEGSKRLYE